MNYNFFKFCKCFLKIDHIVSVMISKCSPKLDMVCLCFCNRALLLLEV